VKVPNSVPAPGVAPGQFIQHVNGGQYVVKWNGRGKLIREGKTFENHLGDKMRVEPYGRPPSFVGTPQYSMIIVKDPAFPQQAADGNPVHPKQAYNGFDTVSIRPSTTLMPFGIYGIWNQYSNMPQMGSPEVAIRDECDQQANRCYGHVSMNPAMNGTPLPINEMQNLWLDMSLAVAIRNGINRFDEFKQALKNRLENNLV